MKLRTVGMFVLMVAAVLLLGSCKSTKKVKTAEPANTENAESVETETFTATEEAFEDTPAPATVTGEDDYYYDDTEEVFVDVNENDYMYVDDDEDYTDVYSDYDKFDSEFIETGYDDSLINNDYSDDYPAEPSSTAPATVAATTTTPATTQPVETSKETEPAQSTTKPAETTQKATDTAVASTTPASSSTGKKGSVSSGSFYIDYNSPEYSDYSGYDYGDKSYNETLQKFGPASFPSDKLMAKGRKSAKQLYNYFASKNPNGDLQRAWILAQLYIEECAYEGVNSDLAFVQMCHETGFLRFGNLVTPDMNNFCGLGSVSKANPGHRFATDREGVRAHVQHLQAYGSTKALNGTLIDPRYKYVKPRGKAKTLAGLTGTWAADPNYDRKIYSFMKELAHF